MDWGKNVGLPSIVWFEESDRLNESEFCLLEMRFISSLGSPGHQKLSRRRRGEVCRTGQVSDASRASTLKHVPKEICAS